MRRSAASFRVVLRAAAEFVKTINAVSIRQQRPFRAATAADDATIVFHQGVCLLVPSSCPVLTIYL